MPDSRDKDREQPDRLEREINEILSNIEQFPGPDARRQRARKRAVNGAGASLGAGLSGIQQAIMRKLSRWSLPQMMLLSFLIILGSFFFREVVRLSWPWLMYAGVLLFLTTFALMVFGGGSKGSLGRGGQQAYWRGRPVEYNQPSLSDRLRRLFSRRPRR